MRTPSNRSYIFLALMLLVTSTAAGQTRERGPWWPHPLWGAEDQAGGSNWVTAESVLRALSLVETGAIHELGHVYERGMPLVGDRTYALFMASFPTAGPIGEERLVFNDEFLSAEIGQVGTQFDGPGHVGKVVDMADGTAPYVFYNGIQGDEMRSPYGLRKNGVEHVGPYITRGILVDLAAARDAPSLPEGYAVTMADVREALRRQGMDESDIAPGDALLFNFGWWRMWPDPVVVDGAIPYLSDEVVTWIVERQASMVGSDLALDGPYRTAHEELVLKNGIFNLEFMNFETLVPARDYEFLFLFTPLRLKGATGSPGRPLAIL